MITHLVRQKLITIIYRESKERIVITSLLTTKSQSTIKSKKGASHPMTCYLVYTQPHCNLTLDLYLVIKK